MKQTSLTITIAILALFASCQTENQIDLLESPTIEQEADKVPAPEITATQDSLTPTKSLLEVDGEGVGTIYWTPADEINVFYGTTSTHYVSQNASNATTAVFRTTDIIGTTEGASENIWGLYPYNENATCTGTAVTTTLPSTQYGAPGTFDDDLFITLAHNTSTALTFYNVCGGIKFSLSRDDITEITFSGNNNEDIAGDISLDFVDSKPHVTVTSGEKTITITPKAGSTFAEGEDYYIILLPGTLSSGFMMTFLTTDGSMGTLNYKSTSVTIKRSVFSKKANIDSYAIFSLPSNVIKYTSTDGNVVTPYSPLEQFGANVVSNTYENGVGTVIFDAPVTSLGQYAYYYYGSRLQTITLPSSIVSVHSNAFNSASSLTNFYGPLAGVDNRSLVLEGKLISVATKGITSYTIPSGVRIIGKRAFDHSTPTAEKIKNVTIPEGVEIIEQDGFYGMNLSGIRLPSTITELGQQWYGDNSIESISLPASVVSIGKSGARFNVVELNSTVPATIGDNAFGTGDNPIYIPNGTLDTYQSAWPEYASRLREKTSIQPLNEIWYTTIDGKPARSDRSNPYIVPEWKQNIISNNDGRMVFDAPLTKVPYDAFENSNLVTVSLPDAMSYLGNNSFQLSTSLEEVTLGKYLTQMTWSSFSGCTALSSINIPNGVSRIEGYMFSHCSSLSSFTIPESVSQIDDHAFYYCSGLTSITSLAVTPPTGGSGMFDNTNNCPIYVPAGSVDSYKTATYWSNYADRIQPIP